MGEPATLLPPLTLVVVLIEPLLATAGGVLDRSLPVGSRVIPEIDLLKSLDV